jgi:peptidoglycan-associated lipoprotein
MKEKTMKKTKWLIVTLAALMVTGCAASKNYVDQQVAESEARTAANISTVENRTELNSEEIARLAILQEELADKTEMMINEARGFEDYEIIWEKSVNYESDSYHLSSVSEETLAECGEMLASMPEAVLEIAGHTDRTGSADHNLILGDKRANAVKRFLAERYDISAFRMFIISYGEEKPIASANDRSANAMNRRAMLRIWGEQ